MAGIVKLPLPPSSKKEPPVPQFAVGTLVALKSCPTGSPGIVRAVVRGRVLVHWADLNYLGRHRPDTLVSTTDAKENIDDPQN